jgi:DNA-binding beta-propeller fold protein YncE
MNRKFFACIFFMLIATACNATATLAPTPGATALASASTPAPKPSLARETPPARKPLAPSVTPASPGSTQVSVGQIANGTAPALPAPPPCTDLVCAYTTINLAQMQGHTPDKNVLKIFSAAADAQRNRVYVAGILTRHIGILDGATEKWIGTVDSGIDGYAHKYLYLDPVANYLYIVDESHQHLRRVDLNANTLAGPVALPEKTGAVRVDSARARLYITTPNAPTFRAFDGKTLQTVYTIAEMGAGAGALALDEKNDVLYVMNMTPKSGGEMFRVDLKTSKLAGTLAFNLPPGQRARWLEYDAARARFLVGSERAVLVLDANGKELHALALSPERALENIAYDPAHERLVVLWSERPSAGQVAGIGGYLQVYDVNTGARTNEFAFGRKPHRLTLNPANGKFYVPNGDASILWSIDTNTYASAAPIRLGDSLEQVILTNGGDRIFMNSRLGGNYIFEYNLAANTWETFASGTWPIPIRADATGEKLFALNAWDSTLAIYDVTGKGGVPPSLRATIPLGLPRGSTDRLPELAIDTAQKRAYVAYPEFGKIVVVDWAAMQVIKTLEVTGFKTGDTGGGPAQLQVAVNENANLLYAFWKNERRLTIYDTRANYTLVATQDLASLDWKSQRDAPDLGDLFLDGDKNRLFVGAFELDAQTGKPTGRKLARGQKLLAVDATTNTYWAIGVENQNGKLTNVVVTLDRDSLATRAAKSLNAVSGVGESFAIDLAHKRLYVGKMTAAELELWVIK